MNRQILEKKVYYYTDVIENFDTFTKVMSELDELDSPDGSVNNWNSWTSSNDKSFIYGVTKVFEPHIIERSIHPIRERMEYIYKSVLDSFFKVSKDYAESLGDLEQPKIFPVFNIKKYNTYTDMGSHFDQLDGDKTLRYSLVMYLNDDYEGGELSFQLKDYNGELSSNGGWYAGVPTVDRDYQVAIKQNLMNFAVKPEKNSVIIFPSGAPYFHTAHEIKKGFKYMIPGHWIN